MKELFATVSLWGAMVCTAFWVTLEGVQLLLVIGGSTLTVIAVSLLCSIRGEDKQ